MFTSLAVEKIDVEHINVSTNKNLESSAEFLDHIFSHGFKIIGWVPSPFFLCCGVVDGLWPGVCDGLSEIWFIGAFKVGYVFFDFFCKFFGGKAHGGHVEITVVFEVFNVCFHKIDGSFDAVGHVHHG